jgi:hypothetical protein
MSTSNLQELAAGLASLPESDPERKEAYRQAENDPELLTALREGERLMALLDMAPPLEAPSQEAMKRTAAAIMTQMDVDEKRQKRAGWVSGLLIPVAAMVGPAMVLMMHGGLETGHAHFPMAAGLLALALLLGAAATLFSKPLMAVAAVAGAGFVALSTQGGLGSLHGGMGCLMMTTISAAAPLAMAVILALRGYVKGGSLLFGGVATVGGLAGMAALHMHCPGLTISHLVAYHLGGLLLGGVGGALLGRIPALRRSPMRA